MKEDHFLLWVHIAILTLGVGIFCLAVLGGIFYLLQQQVLKKKQFNPLFLKIPPLEVLDRFVVRSLILGSFFLTCGMFTGIYLAHIYWEKNWVYDPRFILAIMTWGWYLLLLGLRYHYGWRGPKFFVLIVMGFLFLVTTFFVSMNGR